MNTPLKIAIMLPRFSRYGGVEQFGYHLSEALARKGYAVDFICARQEVEAPEGVRVISVGRKGIIKSVKMLWFLVRAEQKRKKGNYALSISLGKTWNQDLSRVGGGPLSVFWEKSEKSLPKGLPRLAKRLSRRLSPANWLTFVIEKHQFTKDSEVVAVSHLVRDWLLAAHERLDPDHVGIVYNRPDLQHFFIPMSEGRQQRRQALAETFSITLPGADRHDSMPEPVFLGTATTNFALKGIGPLIDALALLPEHVHFFVAGGRNSAVYEKQAAGLGLSGRVHFCGRVEDMPAFYQALDVFILATFYDACSNAVLEALASGCKVLSSACNGSAYFLPAEQVIPDPSDVQDMARRIAVLLESPAPDVFEWPENTPSGIDFFVAKVEGMLVNKTG